MRIRFVNLFVVGAFMCALPLLVACTDHQAEAEIARLQAEKESLQVEIKTLQSKLDSAKAKADSVQKSLSDLDMHR
jgi:peptidoglycan hydrolase CwlO-like protein